MIHDALEIKSDNAPQTRPHQKEHPMTAQILVRPALPLLSLAPLLRRLSLMRAAHRQRAALARLDAAALADIGITAAQASAEARRAAWDIPSGWQA